MARLPDRVFGLGPQITGGMLPVVAVRSAARLSKRQTGSRKQNAVIVGHGVERSKLLLGISQDFRRVAGAPILGFFEKFEIGPQDAGDGGRLLSIRKAISFVKPSRR